MKMRTVKIVGAAGLLLAAVTVFALWRLGNGVDPDDAGVSTVSTIRPAERILTEEQKRALAEYQERVRKHREEALARGDSEGEYEVVRTTGCVGPLLRGHGIAGRDGPEGRRHSTGAVPGG